MSAEVQTWGGQQEAPQVGKMAKQSAELVAWAEGAFAAHSVAKMLCGTDFAPTAFKGNPDAAAAAILRGAELGFDPLVSLGAFHVINGRVTLAAQTMLAVTQAAGHVVEITESTQARCKGRARRAGATEFTSCTWTIDQAKNAGLVKNGGNWTKYPAQMLVARVTSELCKRVAADTLMGLMSSEEAQDIAPAATAAPPQVTPEPVTAEPEPAQDGMTEMSWTPPKQVEAAPEPVATEPEPEPAKKAAGVTQAQMRKLQAAFTSSGTSREERLTQVGQIIGREITTASDLTRDEASQVIEALEAAA